MCISGHISALEESRFVHVKRIASIVGQIVSLSPSCCAVTQIMTRYLHFIVNSRHSWNSSVFVLDESKNELLFWRDNLNALNGVLFWPGPFVPSVVIFFGCFRQRLCGFYSRY